jgi:hypothetical protein
MLELFAVLIAVIALVIIVFQNAILEDRNNIIDDLKAQIAKMDRDATKRPSVRLVSERK